jgi:hypothetical protein
VCARQRLQARSQPLTPGCRRTWCGTASGRASQSRPDRAPARRGGGGEERAASRWWAHEEKKRARAGRADRARCRSPGGRAATNLAAKVRQGNVGHLIVTHLAARWGREGQRARRGGG